MEAGGQTMVPSPGTMVPDVPDEVPEPLSEAVEGGIGEEPPPPREDRGVPVPLVAGGLAALALAVAVGWTLTRPAPVVEPEPPRLSEYTVIVTGLPSQVPVHLTLDGQEGQRQGASFLFAPVVGTNCEGDAVWCHRTEQQVSVEGPSDQSTLELTAPAPTPLVVRAPKLDAGVVRVGDEVLSLQDGAARFDSLRPGPYQVVVGAGECREQDLACWPECPKGCASQRLQVDLPWEGEVEVQAELELVSPAPTGPKEVTSILTVGPTSGPDMRAAAAAVTNAQLGAWLAEHPEWHRDAALAAGKAEGSYLKGWDGATPPEGKGGQAAVNVSWAAANAFCSSRGGLASVDAQPQTWTEGGANPWHEFRQAEGKPAWRRSDGNASTQVGWSETGTFIGFRCKR